jgi:hypothetical protein
MARIEVLGCETDIVGIDLSSLAQGMTLRQHFFYGCVPFCLVLTVIARDDLLYEATIWGMICGRFGGIIRRLDVIF